MKCEDLTELGYSDHIVDYYLKTRTSSVLERMDIIKHCFDHSINRNKSWVDGCILGSVDHYIGIDINTYMSLVDNVKVDIFAYEEQFKKLCTTQLPYDKFILFFTFRGISMEDTYTPMGFFFEKTADMNNIILLSLGVNGDNALCLADNHMKYMNDLRNISIYSGSEVQSSAYIKALTYYICAFKILQDIEKLNLELLERKAIQKYKDKNNMSYLQMKGHTLIELGIPTFIRRMSSWKERRLL